jgi:hypothetical protein
MIYGEVLEQGGKPASLAHDEDEKRSASIKQNPPDVPSVIEKTSELQLDRIQVDI